MAAREAVEWTGQGDPRRFADAGAEPVDLDEDGFTEAQGDCNDDDELIHPDAEEVCDGVDNNCNQETDEGVMPTWYLDSDGDTYGSPSLAVAIKASAMPGATSASVALCTLPRDWKEFMIPHTVPNNPT